MDKAKSFRSSWRGDHLMKHFRGLKQEPSMQGTGQLILFSAKQVHKGARCRVCTKACWTKVSSLSPPHHHHRHSLAEHQQGAAPPTVRGRPTKSLALGADCTCGSIGRSRVSEAAVGPQKLRMCLGLAKQLAIPASSELQKNLGVACLLPSPTCVGMSLGVRSFVHRF